MVRADPEPNDIGAIHNPQGTIVDAHTHRAWILPNADRIAVGIKDVISTAGNKRPEFWSRVIGDDTRQFELSL